MEASTSTQDFMDLCSFRHSFQVVRTSATKVRVLNVLLEGCVGHQGNAVTARTCSLVGNAIPRMNSENVQRRLLLSAVLFIAAGLLLVFRNHSQDQLDSLIACRQTQKLIVENTFVRVIDDVIPPGVSDPKHRHPHGLVIAVEHGDTDSKAVPTRTAKQCGDTRAKAQLLGMRPLCTM
jgi:hypothetical protein